jgi:Fe-Mn family superoxide dismutase
MLEVDPMGSQTIEEIIKNSNGKLFNNAAQSWNHTFYWYCMAPKSEYKKIPAELENILIEEFGSTDSFIEKFTDVAKNHFGSGWAWLALNSNGRPEIMGLHDADTPLKYNAKPLLALDVWEHAYYLDYQNKRMDYIEAFWQLVNWSFVQSNLLNKNTGPLMSR